LDPSLRELIHTLKLQRQTEIHIKGTGEETAWLEGNGVADREENNPKEN